MSVLQLFPLGKFFEKLNRILGGKVNIAVYWTLNHDRKGPMRFHPFILPSRSFLRIGSLALLETQHGVQGACGVLRLCIHVGT